MYGRSRLGRIPRMAETRPKGGPESPLLQLYLRSAQGSTAAGRRSVESQV